MSKVSGKTEAEVAGLLMPVIMEGLVITLLEEDNKPLSTETDIQNSIYEFLHDRVRQAVYSLFSETEKWSSFKSRTSDFAAYQARRV